MKLGLLFDTRKGGPLCWHESVCEAAVSGGRRAVRRGESVGTSVHHVQHSVQCLPVHATWMVWIKFPSRPGTRPYSMNSGPSSDGVITGTLFDPATVTSISRWLLVEILLVEIDSAFFPRELHQPFTISTQQSNDVAKHRCLPYRSVFYRDHRLYMLLQSI